MFITIYSILLTIISLIHSVNTLSIEPISINNNMTVVKSAFTSQFTSISSFNMSSSSLPAVLSNQNQIFILKWSVRLIGGLLIIVGGIGNTLSALTLSRKKLRAQVTSIYLIALALSDLGNVFFSVLNFYLVRIDPTKNMRLYSNLSCKFHIFFTYYFINLSPTLLVAVSVQRYLSIAKHQYSKRHCTVKNAYIIISAICLISFLIQLHWAIFYEIQLVPKRIPNNMTAYQRVCNVSSDYRTYLWFRSHILGYLQWFFFTLCPFLIMLILNSLILKVIASARRIQQHMNQKNQRKRAKQRNMTIMLLSVSCVFILLTAPASTFMAFGHLLKNLHGPNAQSLWIMFSLIYYTNTAANFLLYFLTANVFRQELRVMFLSVCSKFLSRPYQLTQDNTQQGTAANLTTMGKTQLTPMPLALSTCIQSDDEQTNGIPSKRPMNNNSFLTNSKNQLLSLTFNVNNSSRKSSVDENSQL